MAGTSVLINHSAYGSMWMTLDVIWWEIRRKAERPWSMPLRDGDVKNRNGIQFPESSASGAIITSSPMIMPVVNC